MLALQKLSLQADDVLSDGICCWHAGLLAGRRWRAALVTYSAAVSIKMNVLLMAPPVLVVMLKVSDQFGKRWCSCCHSPHHVVRQAARLQDIAEGALLGVLLQLLLGAPFLLHDAGAYLSRAFELSRYY